MGCEIPSISDTGNSRISELFQIHFTDPFSAIGSGATSQTSTDNFEFRLRSLIRSAQRSLDIAVYHLSSSTVIQELNEVCNQEVAVRIVTEFKSSGPFSDCIEVVDEQNDRLMHHKFMIIDGKSVWTGSANWTAGGLTSDSNDGIYIQSAELARIYKVEFEEMFSRSRFGTKKRDQNEEKLVIEGVELEIYFAPSDEPRTRLLQLIDEAENSIKIAMFAFTDNEIYQAILDAVDRDVEIDAIWDFHSAEGCQFSEVDEMTKMGIGIVDALPGLLHNKYAIFDERIVVTGSANWSGSGFDHNDENILVVSSPEIAQRYLENFARIYSDALEFTVDSAIPPRLEVRHFESLGDSTLVQWRPHTLNIVENYEICRFGDLISQECENPIILPGWAWYFVDNDAVINETNIYRVRNLLGEDRSAWSNAYQINLEQVVIPEFALDEIERSFRELLHDDLSVRYSVFESFVSDAGNLFLNSRENHESDFTAFIPACAMERFNGIGFDLFDLAGIEVEAQGELIEFDGPEIVLTSPWNLILVHN